MKRQTTPNAQTAYDGSVASLLPQQKAERRAPRIPSRSPITRRSKFLVVGILAALFCIIFIDDTLECQSQIVAAKQALADYNKEACQRLIDNGFAAPGVQSVEEVFLEELPTHDVSMIKSLQAAVKDLKSQKLDLMFGAIIFGIIAAACLSFVLWIILDYYTCYLKTGTSALICTDRFSCDYYLEECIYAVDQISVAALAKGRPISPRKQVYLVYDLAIFRPPAWVQKIYTYYH